MNIVVYIVIAVIALIICVLKYRKILVAIFRIFSSKYSYKYTKFYKKLFNKSPANYCIKDDFMTHMIPFLKMEKESKIFLTNNKIFTGDILFGCSLKKILRLKGKSNCFNAIKINNHYIKIIGYKNYIFNAKYTHLYYLINNRFFMRELTFNNPKEKLSWQIINLLKEKYINDDTFEISNKFYIKNKKENSLIFFRNVGFKIIITYYNNETINIIESLFPKLISENNERQDSNDEEDPF